MAFLDETGLTALWNKIKARTGVSSTSVTYQQSSSGTSIPSGTWYSSPPSATAGYYMWTKTVVTYRSGDTSTSYAVARNGSNGSSTSAYVHIRYSANANGSSMTTSPTSTSKYIGIYSGTSSSAPTSYTSYTWSKYRGEDTYSDATTSSSGLMSSTDKKKLDNIGTMYETAWVRTSSSATNVQFTNTLTLPAGKYIVTLMAPTCNTASGLIGLNVQQDKTYITSASYSAKTLVMEFASETTIYIQSWASTAMSFSNMERGGLRAVRVA